MKLKTEKQQRKSVKQKASRREKVLDRELNWCVLSSPEKLPKQSLSCFLYQALGCRPDVPASHQTDLLLVGPVGFWWCSWHSISFLRKVIFLDFCDSSLCHFPVVKKQTNRKALTILSVSSLFHWLSFLAFLGVLLPPPPSPSHLFRGSQSITLAFHS